MNILERVRSYLFPYDKDIKELTGILRAQSKTLDDTNKRVKGMIATLNGEDDWFLQVVKKGKGGCDDRLSQT